jgi:cytochrome c553
MKKLIILFVVCFGITHFAWADSDLKSGEAKAMVCAGCHGAEGNSAVPNFPKLAGQNAKYIAKQLDDIKKGQRKVVEMTGLLEGMNEQDFINIGAYFESKKAQLSGSNNDKPQIELGERVYRAGNHETGVAACSGCHSPTAQGNSLAGYPRLSGQHSEYIVTQLKAFRNDIRTNDGESATMRGVAAHMSDKEIDAVANFIAGLH